MGSGFSSNQLSYATNSGVPTGSYAYASTNAVSFGVDATYTAFFSEITGAVTPYLVLPTGGPQISCSTISVNTASSLSCPIAGTSLAPGLYTISFSQYSSSFDSATLSVIQANNVYSSLEGAVTFSIVAPATTTITTTPTTTATGTLTSGTVDVTTSTNTIPSTTVDVTSYVHTVSSTTTKTSTITGFSTTKTVTAACPKMTACNMNNCLRALINRSSSASDFCATYTADIGGSPTTPSAFASPCSSLASKLSSACSCLPTATVVERQGSREVGAVEQKRGVVVLAYGPPDYTYLPGEYASGTAYVAVLPTVTQTDTVATVPATTTTDPNATATSGTVTSTVVVPTTTATVMASTVVDSRSGKTTVTITPSTCGGKATSVAAQGR